MVATECSVSKYTFEQNVKAVRGTVMSTWKRGSRPRGQERQSLGGRYRQREALEIGVERQQWDEVRTS